MEASADFLGGTKFRVAARGHRVICDQPLDNGGRNEGMSPPEFLLASLATCAGYYAAEYLRTRNLPTVHLHVRVTAQKATQPARLAAFGIEVTTLPLDQRHQAGLLRAVKTCLVHNTLLAAPVIEVSLRTTLLEQAS